MTSKNAVLSISLSTLLPILSAGCAPAGDDHMDITYDACAPLVVVPDEGTNEREVRSIDEAMVLWNEAAGTLLTRDDVADAGRVVVRFEHAPSAFHGVYLDEEGVVVINDGMRDDRARAITIAHELGHAYGLWHVSRDTRRSVMNPGNDTVTPNAEDVAALFAEWGDCP